MVHHIPRPASEPWSTTGPVTRPSDLCKWSDLRILHYFTQPTQCEIVPMCLVLLYSTQMYTPMHCICMYRCVYVHMHTHVHAYLQCMNIMFVFTCNDYHYLVFQAPQAGTNLTLMLVSLTLGASAATTATVSVSPCSRPVYSFANTSKFVVTESGSSSAAVTIQRTKCRFIRDDVIVSTSSPSTTIKLGSIDVNPAMADVDYTRSESSVQFREGAVSYLSVQVGIMWATVCTYVHV